MTTISVQHLNYSLSRPELSYCTTDTDRRCRSSFDNTSYSGTNGISAKVSGCVSGQENKACGGLYSHSGSSLPSWAS